MARIRSVSGPYVHFAFLPEIAAFLLFILVSIQEAGNDTLIVLMQMGLIGLFFIIRPSAFLGTLLKWWPLLLTPTLAMSIFCAILLRLLLSRAFTNLIITPFSIHTILLCACGVYAFWKPENAVAQDQPFAWLNLRRPGAMPSMTR